MRSWARKTVHPKVTWRLTRPGRLGLMVATTLALVGVLALGAAPILERPALASAFSGSGSLAGGGANQAGNLNVVIEVTVEPGDTLWTLATRYFQGTDPRVGVARLRRLNQLKDGSIQAGQTLKVELPTGAVALRAGR